MTLLEEQWLLHRLKADDRSAAERRNDFPNRSEVWRYYRLQGGVVFVFVEKDAMGDMRLVHSIARDEVAGLGGTTTALCSAAAAF